MKTLSYDECIDITESYAYLNIPISVIQYCTARISRSAFTLWIKLRDMTKYLTNWAINVTNKLLGRYIFRSEHRAYMLLRELEKAGLVEKKHDLGKSCTIYVRMPESIKDNPVLKSNTPCKNTGGTHLYNNNYVINNNTTIAARTINKAVSTVRNFFVKKENDMNNDPMNNPANWQKMKQEYIEKLRKVEAELAIIQAEPHPFQGIRAENTDCRSLKSIMTQINAQSPESILKAKERLNKQNALSSQISSLNIALNCLEARLNGIGKSQASQKPTEYKKPSTFLEPAKYADRRNYAKPVDNRRTSGYNGSYRTYNPD